MQSVVCRNCNHPVLAGDRFCEQCGSAVEGMDGGALPETEGDRSLLEALRHATLGDYEIREELGRGGMAIVYLAHDIRLNKKVAMKVLLAHLQLVPGMTSRFLREAQIAAGLEHPNIIPIYNYRATDGIVYFTMRYMAGATLSALAKQVGQLPIAVARALLWDVGSALSFAHAHGVLHRDVKPGNVILGRDGSVVVTDFGIAKQVERQGLTLTGQLLGTPAYMSPEQCRGKDLSPASDQYALGATAFELLAGRAPFLGSSVGELMAAHLTEPPPNLTKLRPDCPKDLASAVARMLSKDASQRFDSIDTALAAMRATPVLSTDPVRQQVRHWVEETAHSPNVSVTPVSPIPRGSAARATSKTSDGSQQSPVSHARWRYSAIGAGVVVTAAAFVLFAVLPRTNPKPDAENAKSVQQVSTVAPTSATPAASPPQEKSSTVAPPSAAPAAPPPQVKSSQAPVEKSAAVAKRIEPPPVSRGTLILRKRPPDGTIRIDGRPVSGSQFDLDSGSHRVELDASGFSLDTVVRLAAGRTATLTFVSPPPKPRGQGALMLRVRPFAKMFIDGRLAAEDELLVTPVLEGAHRLRFEKAGFVTVDTTVVITPGDTVKKLFTLKPQTP